MKKIIVSIFSFALALNLCACGNVADSSDTTSTTTTTVTTAPSTTTSLTTTEELVYDEPFVDIDFDSYDELKTYLVENFADYDCYLPEVDENVYTFTKCHMLDYNTGHYFVTFKHNTNSDRNITIYATPQKEAITFDDVLERYNIQVDFYKDGSDIFDKENRIHYWDGLGNEEPYSLTYITEDGFEIYFDAKNDHSPEELKDKFDEYMSALIDS